MSDQNSRRTMQAVLGLSVVYTMYPVVGAAVVTGTTVTCGTSAYGTTEELIAAAAIANDFWLCACDFDTAGAANVFRTEIGTGTAGVYTTPLMQMTIDAAAAHMGIARYLIGPFPAWVLGGTQIVARSTGTAAEAHNLSVTVATGL